LVGISTSTNNASDFAIQQRTTSGAYRENLRITHAGNVGIGTASPGALIHGKQDVDGISNVLDLENGASSLAPEAVIRLGRPGTSNRRVAIRAIGGSNFTNPKLAFDANESERVRIDDSGRLLVGTSSARGGFDNNSGVSSNLQVEGAGTAAGGTRTALSIVNNGSADADSAGLYLARSGGTAVGSFTAVTADDALGRITFSGADGTEFVTGASIEAVVDGTPGANDLPSRLVFSTTADGASSPTERMRITSTGQVSIASGVAIIDTATSNAPYLALASSPTNATGAEVRMGARVSSSSTSAGIKAIHPDGADPDFVSIGIYVRNSGTSTDPALEIARADYQGSFRPGADNARPLGNASFRWSEVFAGTGTINTSDETLKEDIQDLEQAELTVAAEIKSLIKRFRFKDAVASKGDDARIHVGVIAQEVEQAFVNNGLDPRRYALFCEDTLEDGSKRLGIRYDELLAFVIAAL
jgi:hypothetical protein